MVELLDRYIGSLLGCAIGDALGAPWIGQSAEQIRAAGGGTEFRGSSAASGILIPVAGIADSEVVETLAPGQWTDDTQLTLALAETLIEEAGTLVPEAWAHKLVKWATEGPRGPGLSSLQAALDLRSAALEWDEVSDPEGAGCGAATRAAPIGLLWRSAPVERRRMAALQAEITHGDPDAQAGAVAIAEVVAIAASGGAESIAGGEQLLLQLADTLRETNPAYFPMAESIETVASLASRRISAERALRAVGSSPLAREAVPSALYLATAPGKTFRAMVADAIRLTGNATESIACMVGATAGARLGQGAIPRKWRDGVEGADRISAAANGLYRLSATLEE